MLRRAMAYQGGLLQNRVTAPAMGRTRAVCTVLAKASPRNGMCCRTEPIYTLCTHFAIGMAKYPRVLLCSAL